MTQLNVTQKLWDRLEIKEDPFIISEESLFGSWTAHLFYSGHQQFIIVTNEQTSLTIVFPAKDLQNITTVFPQMVDLLLRNYSISDQIRKTVIQQLIEIQFARNTKRQVLASMKDFISMAKYSWNDNPKMTIAEITDLLNNSTCSPIKMKSPKAATNIIVNGLNTGIPIFK